MSGTTCVECWEEWQSVAVTALLFTLVALGTGIVVSRGGSKRSVAMGIVRILVNYMQTVRACVAVRRETFSGCVAYHLGTGWRDAELHHWRVPRSWSEGAHESHGFCIRGRRSVTRVLSRTGADVVVFGHVVGVVVAARCWRWLLGSPSPVFTPSVLLGTPSTQSLRCASAATAVALHVVWLLFRADRLTSAMWCPPCLCSLRYLMSPFLISICVALGLFVRYVYAPPRYVLCACGTWYLTPPTRRDVLCCVCAVCMCRVCAVCVWCAKCAVCTVCVFLFSMILTSKRRNEAARLREIERRNIQLVEWDGDQPVRTQKMLAAASAKPNATAAVAPSAPGPTPSAPPPPPAPSPRKPQSLAARGRWGALRAAVPELAEANRAAAGTAGLDVSPTPPTTARRARVDTLSSPIDSSRSLTEESRCVHCQHPCCCVLRCCGCCVVG